MQPKTRTKISPKTVQNLIEEVCDPRRLGGHTRAIRVISRTHYGETYKAFFGRDIKTIRDLQDFFSTMLEEDVPYLLALLEARMPDTTNDAVQETVLRLRAA